MCRGWFKQSTMQYFLDVGTLLYEEYKYKCQYYCIKYISVNIIALIMGAAPFSQQEVLVGVGLTRLLKGPTSELASLVSICLKEVARNAAFLPKTNQTQI